MQITIPKPCSENWQAMTPNALGRHCDSCAKTVVDFTRMSDEEVQAYFHTSTDQRVCGRFRSSQLATFNLQIQAHSIRKPQQLFWAILLTVFGTSLFSCSNHQNQTLGEVEWVDSLHQQKVDSIQPEPMELTGDTTYYPPKTEMDSEPESELEKTGEVVACEPEQWDSLTWMDREIVLGNVSPMPRPSTPIHTGQPNFGGATKQPK